MTKTHLIRISQSTKAKLDALRTTGYASRPVKLTYNNTIGQLLNDSDNLTLLRLFLECTVTRYSWSDRQKSLERLQVEVNRQIEKEQQIKEKQRQRIKEREFLIQELDELSKEKTE
jgi:3-methyladenine DNA glycosylase AlkC